MPTKAIYEEFDANPAYEFDFYLAQKLGWRSVDVMRREMSMDEWMHWSIYYQREAQRRELESMKAGG